MSIHAADYPRHRPKTDDIPANNKLNTFNNNHQPSATFAPLPISTTPSPFFCNLPFHQLTTRTIWQPSSQTTRHTLDTITAEPHTPTTTAHSDMY